MSERPEKESRTEEATEKKVLDSLQKGNVPYSKEASTFASLAGILLVASMLLADQVAELAPLLRFFMENAGDVPLGSATDAELLLDAVLEPVGQFLLPIVSVLAVAGLGAALLQNPPRFAIQRVTPQFNRISLAKGCERIFGARGRVEFLKSIFKFSAISAVVFITFQAERFSIYNAMFADASAVPEQILSVARKVLFAICATTILLAAADLVWSRMLWRNDLKMTRQEVKDEHKQMDGDPIVKARMRSLTRDRNRRRMIASVPRATLVVTNPTHFAVALRYDRAEDEAPRVLAKGKNLIALKIREIAVAHSIPIIEDKPLARSLYDGVEIDQMIPPEFYKAIAEIITYAHTRQPAGHAAPMQGL